MVHLTATEVLTSLTLYAIIHAIIAVFSRLWAYTKRTLQSERDHIIKSHIKSGHPDRLKYCEQDACATLETLSQIQVG